MSNYATVTSVPGSYDRVECDGTSFGLGLIVPNERVLDVPTLASRVPLLSFEEIRRITDSEDFKFGRSLFDASWTTNQNGYGSCAAYAGKSALEKMRHTMGQERIELSGDHLYSLVNGGYDRGSLLKDVMRKLMFDGVATAATVPLGAIYPSKYDQQKANAEKVRFRGHELYAVPDEQSSATALAMGMILVNAIHVTNRWRQFDSDNFLAPAPGPGNHSEHCDDIYYDRKRGCFAMRKGTSHSVNYNPDHGGYCWTTWDAHYKTTSQYHVFYAVGAAIEDPAHPSPPLPFDYEQPDPIADTISLTMYSRASCSFCVKFEREQLPKVQAARWEFHKIDATGSVPRFVIKRGDKTQEITGYKPFEVLREIAEGM